MFSAVPPFKPLIDCAKRNMSPAEQLSDAPAIFFKEKPPQLIVVPPVDQMTSARRRSTNTLTVVNHFSRLLEQEPRASSGNRAVLRPGRLLQPCWRFARQIAASAVGRWLANGWRESLSGTCLIQNHLASVSQKTGFS
jgi:hypothetical protein